MKIKELDGKRKENTDKSTPPAKVIFSVQIDKKLADKLIRIANSEKVSRSELMRYVLAAFVDEYNKK